MRDLTGAFDDDGNHCDGAPDNPGQYYGINRLDWSKDNYNLSLGFVTWPRPQDKKLQTCKEAAEAQIAMQRQLTANKRLDFELARLKTCANLISESISIPRVLIIFYVQMWWLLM